VEVEKDDGDEDAYRRAKIWSGIAADAGDQYVPVHPGIIEEGEIPREVFERTQAAVLGLLPVLQGRVAGANNHYPPHLPQPPIQPLLDAHHPPPTLASVIARAQAASSSSDPSAPMASLVGPPPAATGQTSASTETQDVSSSLLSWLSEEQTKMLEQAIAQAAAAARAQAEAEAALEEGGQDEHAQADVNEDGEEEIDVE